MTVEPRVTLLVHTRNSERHMSRLLESTNWCDERIIIDMSSTDSTVELAVAGGCRVIAIEAEMFVDELRNQYLAEPTGEWTVVLDSDEWFATDAEQGIRGLTDGAETSVTGFALPRFNRVAGQVLTGPVWYPDHQVRLFRSDSIRYLPGHHRRPVPVDPETVIVTVDPSASIHIHHDNYDSIVQFIERQVRYAVTDVYDTDPSTFDFNEYLVEGQRQFDARYAPESDGSMSYALATVMYWNEVIRGLISWEASGRRAPLPTIVPGPDLRRRAELVSRDADLHRRLAELEELLASYRHQLDALRRSRSMRFTAPLRRLRQVIRGPRR